MYSGFLKFELGDDVTSASGDKSLVFTSTSNIHIHKLASENIPYHIKANVTTLVAQIEHFFYFHVFLARVLSSFHQEQKR